MKQLKDSFCSIQPPQAVGCAPTTANWKASVVSQAQLNTILGPFTQALQQQLKQQPQAAVHQHCRSQFAAAHVCCKLLQRTASSLCESRPQLSLCSLTHPAPHKLTVCQISGSSQACITTLNFQPIMAMCAKKLLRDTSSGTATTRGPTYCLTLMQAKQLPSDSDYKLPVATDEHREIMMVLEWQSVQKQLCKKMQGPNQAGHTVK
jgi:hypothetical protein